MVHRGYESKVGVEKEVQIKSPITGRVDQGQSRSTVMITKWHAAKVIDRVDGRWKMRDRDGRLSSGEKGECRLKCPITGRSRSIFLMKRLARNNDMDVNIGCHANPIKAHPDS